MSTLVEAAMIETEFAPPGLAARQAVGGSPLFFAKRLNRDD